MDTELRVTRVKDGGKRPKEVYEGEEQSEVPGTRATMGGGGMEGKSANPRGGKGSSSHLKKNKMSCNGWREDSGRSRLSATRRCVGSNPTVTKVCLLITSWRRLFIWCTSHFM